MYRLTRYNEVQYTNSEAQKERLIEEGFIVDETPQIPPEEPKKRTVRRKTE